MFTMIDNAKCISFSRTVYIIFLAYFFCKMLYSSSLGLFHSLNTFHYNLFTQVINI